MKKLPFILLVFSFYFLVSPLSAQTLKGTLTDAGTGEAIPFATVVLEGTRHGTATDLNGFYLIN